MSELMGLRAVKGEGTESGPPRYGDFVAFSSGIAGLAGPGLFLGGILAHHPALWIAEGITMAALDLVTLRYSSRKDSQLGGAILLAIPFLIFIRPWYLAVFWSLFVVHLPDVPWAIYKVLFPRRVSRQSWLEAVARVKSEEQARLDWLQAAEEGGGDDE